MKIAFTGAQSTGKTTLLEALKQNEKLRYEYEFIDEITRRMIKKGLKINEEGSETTQLLIINEHIKNLLYPNVIMDRCILDGVVYTRWLYEKGNVDRWVWDYAHKVFEKYKERYDYVFYLVPEFDIVDDGVRSTDAAFRNEIADLFESYIDISGNLNIIPLTGSVEERLNRIYKTLKIYGD